MEYVWREVCRDGRLGKLVRVSVSAATASAVKMVMLGKAPTKVAGARGPRR